MTVATGKKPLVFDEFFEMGFEDHVSPFLTPQARRWGVNLMLKASIFAAILLALAYLFRYLPGLEPLSILCLFGVYFFAGMPALIESVEDLLRFELNIDILMTLAAFSSVLIGSPFEGGMLLVLFAISGSMEDAVTEKAKGAISALYKLSPSIVSVYDEKGELTERSIKDVLVGEKILVKGGEIIPLDGVILEGSTTLNLVHLTGESVPIPKKEGDPVPAGAQNLEGVLVLLAPKTEPESTVPRTTRLVTKAQEPRPHLDPRS
ncbi:MAG: cation-transporting P-type ATPase, partial [Chlamydiia bacterium]|nr:cation-transporting P-type ATPase [Chlamydiia bacterium]